MKTVSVFDAVGMVLCHDVTQIVPGTFKGPAFKKGYVIKREDIPRLLDMGKENIYVFDLKEGLLHENDAAFRIARAAAGEGISLSPPKEGKVELTASRAGLLKVNTGALYEINEIEEVMFASLHSNQHVPEGKTCGGTRVIPLVIAEEKVILAEEVCQKAAPLFTVLPYKSCRVGLVTTGSEVYSGRIQDKFGPVIRKKVEKYGSSLLKQVFVADSAEDISRQILSLISEGADVIAVTGGMSVDPDDLSPTGIRLAGGEIITYGAPTLPGAMFMLAYIGTVPVLGLPGCVMYHQTSIFDLILPRILAGEKVTRKEIIHLAAGGLCLNCRECRYPDCGFGKGF